MAGERYDVAILGAGCAGLAAGTALVESGRVRRLILLDARSGYTNDRTWCSWSVEPHGFEAAVAHVWPRCLVRHAGREIIVEPRRYAYRCIPGLAYYDLAREKLAGRAELALGEPVEHVASAADTVHITTPRRTIRADRAIDARWNMDAAPTPPGGLIQDFLGQRIRTAGPVFDPTTATLMDFDVPQDTRGVHFCYVLPFSEREALVEPTFLGSARLPEAAFRERIRSYLRERHGVGEYEVLAEERGHIPMGLGQQATPHSRIQRAGTGGGLVKASSGYGFHAMQRHGSMLAAGGSAAPRPALASRLDSLFVGFLRDEPALAPAAFFRLFERVDPDRLARFLSDAATPADYAAVLRAAPTAPMLRQVARRISGRSHP
jgi:lycopene beta-cyclase